MKLVGDKEFITRIQLSQLVTQDPYTSDFYAQVHSAITRARLAAVGQPVGRGPSDGPTVLQVGPGGQGLGVGVVRSTGGPKRLKETAMQRMTVQVKRIVENAQKRATAAPSGQSDVQPPSSVICTDTSLPLTRQPPCREPLERTSSGHRLRLLDLRSPSRRRPRTCSPPRLPPSPTCSKALAVRLPLTATASNPSPKSRSCSGWSSSTN